MAAISIPHDPSTQTRVNQNELPQYVTRKELCELLGIGLSTLCLILRTGNGPAEIQIGDIRRYDMSVVRAWIASRTVGGSDICGGGLEQ